MGATPVDAGRLNAAAYARQLLADLGAASLRAVSCADEHPAHGWARSGLMALTGAADGAPQLCPVPLTLCADGALAALASLAPAGAFDDLRGSQLLAERAAIAGYRRRGPVSPGGACRLLDTGDGAIALNLTRDDDWSLLPAWLETDIAPDWTRVAAAVRDRTMHDCVERGRELGLAVAPLAPPMSRPVPWFQQRSLSPRNAGGEGWGEGGAREAPTASAHPSPRLDKLGSDSMSLPSSQTPSPPSRGERETKPRVLDLSSLWAGPVCSHLLQRCGADVVKLESTRRPDGARSGPPAFFDLLNAGKRSVALDFATAEGRAQLRALIGRADIVIEASRPRALRQLGIDAEALVQAHSRLTWISLTGHGRAEPQAQWIAYGDDAGVAAGLSYLMRVTTGQAMFVGDAIADPLAGLHAALAAWASWQAGGGGLISIALVDVVRHCIGFGAPANLDGWRARAQDWSAQVTDEELRGPTARAAAGIAPALGADNAAVLADWGVAC